MEPFLQSLRPTLGLASTAPPGVLFIALSLLALFGIPANPLWVAMGARMGPWSGTGLAFGYASDDLRERLTFSSRSPDFIQNQPIHDS